jgi:uncharacterized membrane-anchored protein
MPDRATKKGPIVADRAWKFWERMPERPVLYAEITDIVQVRNRFIRVQKLQRMMHNNVSSCFK